MISGIKRFEICIHVVIFLSDVVCWTIFLDAEEAEKSIYFVHDNFLKYLKDLVLQTLKYEKSFLEQFGKMVRDKLGLCAINFLPLRQLPFNMIEKEMAAKEGVNGT